MTRRLIDLPLARLDDGPNVRRKIDAGLVKSVAEHGVLEPIVVVDEWPDDLPIRQVVENIDRQEMNPVDIARALHEHLAAHPGLTQADLAKSLNRSGYWISRKLALLELDPEIRSRVELGQLGESRALDGRVDAGSARKGRPRILQAGDTPGRSRSIVIPLKAAAGHRGQVVIGVDLDERHVDFVVEDGTDHSLMFSLSPDEARLLGRRLLQAYEAVAVAS